MQGSVQKTYFAYPARRLFKMDGKACLVDLPLVPIKLTGDSQGPLIQVKGEGPGVYQGVQRLLAPEGQGAGGLQEGLPALVPGR